jgi:NAD(P)H dehydrogenase (quinone)
MKQILFLTLILLNLNAYGADMETTKILILYHSQDGATLKLAKAVKHGAEENPQTKVTLKEINNSESLINDLTNYDGIAFGSPVYFGAMSGQMKSFFDRTLPLWKDQKLSGIPATVFMSAGSGAGSETAIMNTWSILASHGMSILTLGGVQPFGTISKQGSEQELKLAQAQGLKLAVMSSAFKHRHHPVELPEAPKAVGNYKPFQIAGKLIYINQIALDKGVVKNAGKIGETVSIEKAKESTKQTALNVLAVLKDAVGGDLTKVKNTIQLTGYFNTTTDFQEHAAIMNEASDLVVSVLGERGKHARATMGAPSLPMNSPVEIQAIFEMK